MTVRNIFDFLNELYPIDTACDFDNPGILVGDCEQKVSKALVSLDCTLHTIEVAKNNGCELIITHHPVIFHPLKNLLKGSVAYELASNNIAVISMHTNLDIGDGGINDSLAKTLKLQNIKTIVCDDGYVLKGGDVETTNANNFADYLKEILGGRIKFVDAKKPIAKVLLCGGSGGDYLYEAKKHNFDALVTADIKHNFFLEAKDLGVSLFDAGHFNTEDVVIEPLKDLLQNKFPKISFLSDHTTFIEYK